MSPCRVAQKGGCGRSSFGGAFHVCTWAMAVIGLSLLLALTPVAQETEGSGDITTAPPSDGASTTKPSVKTDSPTEAAPVKEGKKDDGMDDSVFVVVIVISCAAALIVIIILVREWSLQHKNKYYLRPHRSRKASDLLRDNPLFNLQSVAGGDRQNADKLEQQPLTGNGTDAGAGSSRNSLDFHKEDEEQGTEEKANALASSADETDSKDKEKDEKASSTNDTTEAGKDEKISTDTRKLQEEKPQEEKPQEGKPQEGKPQEEKPQEGKPQEGESTTVKSTENTSVPATEEKAAVDSTTSVTAGAETTTGSNANSTGVQENNESKPVDDKASTKPSEEGAKAEST